MDQHGATRNWVQYFVLSGFHARALPGGKDDDGKGTIGGHGGTRPSYETRKFKKVSILCHGWLAFATAEGTWAMI